MEPIPHLPCLIAPGLFLGSRNVSVASDNTFDRTQLSVNRYIFIVQFLCSAFLLVESTLLIGLCECRDYLTGLGITHIFVNGNMPLPFERVSDIQTLRCNLPDSNNLDMKVCSSPVTHFLCVVCCNNC